MASAWLPSKKIQKTHCWASRQWHPERNKSKVSNRNWPVVAAQKCCSICQSVIGSAMGECLHHEILRFPQRGIPPWNSLSWSINLESVGDGGQDSGKGHTCSSCFAPFFISGK